MEQAPFDLAVIGAGIEGSWAAYHGIKAYKKVLLIDQFPLPHTRGSSHGQSRIIRHSYAELHHAKLMPKAFNAWREVELISDEQLFIPKPLLCIADETGERNYQSTLASLKAVEHNDYKQVSFKTYSATELRNLFPQLRISDKHKGILENSAGILRADKCLETIQKLYIKSGGEIMDKTKVLDLKKLVNCIRIKLEDNKFVYATKVAVCAGPWSAKLLDPLLSTKLPLTTLRVNVYYWKIKDDGPGALPTSFIDLSDNGEFWGIPEFEYPGMVKYLHPTYMECDPENLEKYDKRIYKEETRQIREFISTHFPGIDSHKPAIKETCMYTMTPDHTCIIDYVPGSSGNIVYACGMSGAGFKKAPVIGQMLIQMLQFPSEIQLKHFNLSRFNTLCSHHEEKTDPDDRDLNFKSVNYSRISKYIRKRFPGLEENPSIIETCIYTMTPDGTSIIDYIPDCKNIVFAAGFSGTGFKKAPEIGRILIQMLQNNSDYDLKPYSMSRFNITSKI